MRSPMQWYRNHLQETCDTMTLLDLDDNRPRLARRHVEQYGALFSSAFLACETTKARAIGQLPVHVFDRGDSSGEPVSSDPLAYLIAVRPNPLMTAQEMWEWFSTRKDSFGNSYIRVARDTRGRPRLLMPLLTKPTIRYDRDTEKVLYSFPGDFLNPPCDLDEGEVIVGKTDVSTDGGIRGRSLAELAAADIGLSIDLPEFYRQVMQNGNHMGGWLETDKDLKQPDIDAIKLSLSKTSGNKGAGGTRIFDRGLKYKSTEIVLKDLSLIEQQTWILEQVCRVTHVDPHHVYDDKSSSNSSSVQSDIDFAKHSIGPEVTAIESALKPILDAQTGGRDSGLYVKFSLEGLMRGDFSTRMNAYRIGVYAGIFTRAWCAKKEDAPVLPGMERVLQPTAYCVLDDEGNPTLPTGGAGTSGQSDGVSGLDAAAEAHGSIQGLAPFIADAKARIRARVAKDGDTPRTRDFASTVTAPIAQACALAGIDYDIESITEEAFNAQEMV